MNSLVCIGVAICLVVVGTSGRAVNENSNGASRSAPAWMNPSHSNGWSASIMYNGEFLCSGTIVHELYIVTTATCLKGRLAEDLKVLVGVQEQQYMEVNRIKFIARDGGSNIGLVTLMEPINLVNGIVKVNLPKKQLPNEVSFIDMNGSTIEVTLGPCSEEIDKEFMCAGVISSAQCYGYQGSGAVKFYPELTLIGVGESEAANPNCGSGKFNEVYQFNTWLSEMTNGDL